MNGVVLPADITRDPFTVTWEQDDLLLDVLYQQIECDTVDAIRVDSPDGELTMWVDDEFLMRGVPLWNSRAIAFLMASGRSDSFVAGNVVLTGGVDAAGATLGLPPVIAEIMLDVRG